MGWGKGRARWMYVSRFDVIMVKRKSGDASIRRAPQAPLYDRSLSEQYVDTMDCKHYTRKRDPKLQENNQIE